MCQSSTICSQTCQIRRTKYLHKTAPKRYRVSRDLPVLTKQCCRVLGKYFHKQGNNYVLLLVTLQHNYYLCHGNVSNPKTMRTKMNLSCELLPLWITLQPAVRIVLTTSLLLLHNQAHRLCVCCVFVLTEDIHAAPRFHLPLISPRLNCEDAIRARARRIRLTDCSGWLMIAANLHVDRPATFYRASLVSSVCLSVCGVCDRWEMMLVWLEVLGASRFFFVFFFVVVVVCPVSLWHWRWCGVSRRWYCPLNA